MTQYMSETFQIDARSFEEIDEKQLLTQERFGFQRTHYAFTVEMPLHILWNTPGEIKGPTFGIDIWRKMFSHLVCPLDRKTLENT